MLVVRPPSTQPSTRKNQRDDSQDPDRWIAEEHGDGISEPIRFELYWLPLAQGHVLAAGQSALLGRLLD